MRLAIVNKTWHHLMHLHPDPHIVGRNYLQSLVQVDEERLCGLRLPVKKPHGSHPQADLFSSSSMIASRSEWAMRRHSTWPTILSQRCSTQSIQSTILKRVPEIQPHMNWPSAMSSFDQYGSSNFSRRSLAHSLSRQASLLKPHETS